MPERWPQVCRVKITFKLLLTICSVFTTTNSMKYFVNWIPLNTHVRFENTQPCLNVLFELQLVPKIGKKMRLEMVIGIQNEILDGHH